LASITIFGERAIDVETTIEEDSAIVLGMARAVYFESYKDESQ